MVRKSGRRTSIRKMVNRRKGWRKLYDAERASRNISKDVTENEEGMKEIQYIQTNNMGYVSYVARGSLSDISAVKEISKEETIDSNIVEDILIEEESLNVKDGNDCNASCSNVIKLTPLISKLQEHLKSCRRKPAPSNAYVFKSEKKLSDEKTSRVSSYTHVR